MTEIKKLLIKSVGKLSRMHLNLCKEKNSLITFLFHALTRNEREFSSNLISPKPMTVNYFRKFVEYFMDHGYVFVSPDDILKGLNNDGKYILITFDDGYFNNTYSLPIIQEFEIPAVFFITTNYVKYDKSFWWNILYRERLKRGVPERDIIKETAHLKSKKHLEIELYLKNLFGDNVLKPVGDDDRPFTISELKDFAKERYVFLGNHTSDHDTLTNCSSNDIKSQILGAQEFLNNITKIKPVIISYPYGDYSNEVIKISKELGLKLGITVKSRKNYLPINSENDDNMHLGRFSFEANDTLIDQFSYLRSDMRLLKYTLSAAYRVFFRY